MKKYIKPMYRIFDVVFLDAEEAKSIEDGKETVKRVFVGIDDYACDLDLNGISTDYFGNWIFSNEEEALAEMNEFNHE